jgi:hypothetical protein
MRSYISYSLVFLLLSLGIQVARISYRLSSFLTLSDERDCIDPLLRYSQLMSELLRLERAVSKVE